jgi:antitoxin CptB
MSIDDARLRKLKFRAWRRGFREADLILGPFADNHVAGFTPEELDWFEAMLEAPDHDLYNWIVERDPTPPEWDCAIMNRIKQFRYETHKVIGPDHGG